MWKKIQMRAILLEAALLLVLTACGTQVISEERKTTAEPEFTALQLKTEAEYREAIARLDGGAASAVQGEEYYEQLLAMDAFTEADYTALAEIYAKLGKQEEQYRMLSKVHRLYPSEVYIEQMSEFVWQKDGSDATVKELIGKLVEALQGNEPQELQSLFASEIWQEEFGAELVGVEQKTVYKQDEQKVNILSTDFSTVIFCFPQEGELIYCKSSENGVQIFRTGWAEETCDGSFSMVCYDGTGVESIEYRGTFDQGNCVEELVVILGGKEYKGRLDSEGRTLEEQLPSVSESGGVVYAYCGDSYLYEEDTSVSDLSVNQEYLGIDYSSF